DDETKVLNLGHFKLALLRSEIELVLPKDLEYTLGNLLMFFERTSENKNII
ncbi:hypothetical protein PAXINDRAFT_59459, partial [Paxillus involutus ATCC 200175]